MPWGDRVVEVPSLWHLLFVWQLKPTKTVTYLASSIKQIFLTVPYT